MFTRTCLTNGFARPERAHSPRALNHQGVLDGPPALSVADETDMSAPVID